MSGHFDDALSKVLAHHYREGIGTLSEGTLHAVIKHYLDPDESHHEQKCGRSVCDVFDGDHIFEIQTRQLFKLNKKLERFLPEKRVTVVFPISAEKHVYWIDLSTGEMAGGRKSTRAGRKTDVLPELYGIREHLTNPNFDVLILLFKMDEYRNLDGWGRGGKRGSSRYDRIPRELFDELRLKTAVDYRALLPDNIPDSFTAKEFAKLTKLRLNAAYQALLVLETVGAVKVERNGRTNTYFLVPSAVKEMLL